MYLIIDTDFGDDIDDAFSLAYLLKRARGDIHLVLSAFGDTEKRAQSIGDFLHRAGCDEIPVGVGIKSSEQDPAQYLFQPQDVTYPVIEDGLAEAARLIRESDEVVTLVALGPATNLAALIERYPDCKDKVRIVSMFGSVRGGYFGSPDPINEYNVIMDIPAGKTFLGSGWDISLTPLDTCGNLFMRRKKIGHYYKLIKPCLTAKSFGSANMSEMRRIKRSAVKPDFSLLHQSSILFFFSDSL